ncbi:MAG: choice-of-anchor D domain-containing protein [Desulfomonilia bacterium]
MKIAAPGGQEVRPGESQKLAVSMSSKGYRNTLEKHIQIQTNDPDAPQVKLSLKAKVLEVLSVSPPILNFGSVKEGLTYTKQITISNSSKTPVTITGIEGKPSQFVIVAHQPEIVLDPGKSHTLDISLSPASTRNRFHGYLSIATDLEFLPTKIIRVVARISTE